MAIAFQRVDAKEFVSRIDGAIAIAIQHQPAVIWHDPSSACFNAITVVIEQDNDAVPGTSCFDAIAVKIEHKGISSRWRCAGCTCIGATFTGATRSATTVAVTTDAVAALVIIAVPPILRIDAKTLRVFHLIMNMLGILICTIWSASTHCADGGSRIYLLSNLDALGIGMEDLVAIALRITDLNRSVLAANVGNRATYW
ncbi:hypothetical protein AB851_01265 [Ralstonia pseudosolanacearum]|nr:hypothetical protein AB851_01265 [Ralstonia pseudosolanacearum]